MLLYCCMLPLTFMLLYQKRGSSAVLKLFNRSHKSKKTRPNSAALPPYRELFTQRISRFSDSKFLCCHLLELEDVITEERKGFLVKRDRVFLFSVIRYYKKNIIR